MRKIIRDCVRMARQTLGVRPHIRQIFSWRLSLEETVQYHENDGICLPIIMYGSRNLLDYLIQNCTKSISFDVTRPDQCLCFKIGNDGNNGIILLLSVLYKHHCEKTGIRDFLPGPT